MVSRFCFKFLARNSNIAVRGLLKARTHDRSIAAEIDPKNPASHKYRISNPERFPEPIRVNNLSSAEAAVSGLRRG